MAMKRKVAWNSLAALLSRLVALVSGFILPRLLLEHFGSEVNGLTQSIKQFLGVISFLDLGVGQVMRSALYKPLAAADHHRISCIMVSGKKYYRTLAYMLMGYVLILICIYPLITEQLFDWLFTATLIIAMAISSFAQFYLGIANEQLLQADQRGYVIFLLQVVGNVANILISVWMIRMGASIQAVNLASSLVFLLRPVVVWLYVRRVYAIDDRARYTVEPIAQKKEGVAQHISAVVLDGTDTIVLTLLSSLTNVSIYSVYYLVITSVQGFYQSATAGVQSAVGLMWAMQDKKRMHSMFVTVETVLHVVVVFVFSCMGVLIVPFIRVYTAGLTDADYVQPLFAALLVLAYGIRCLRTPYNMWILAAGHYRETQKCHIWAALINLAVSALMVTQLGLVGVAIGTLIAMVYQTIWMALYNTRALLKRPVRSIIKRFAVDALMAGLICVLTRGIHLTAVGYVEWVWMAIKVALIAAAVVATVMMLCYRTEVSMILKRLARRFKRQGDDDATGV